MLPSKSYREWQEAKSWELKAQKLPKLEGFKKIEITIYAPDKRSADLSNKTESIMDLLVDNGVIEDDNWFICGRIEMIFGGVDTQNPRADILID